MIWLALSGVRHHIRLYVGVVVSVALCAAIWVSGLGMGDSLRVALQTRVEAQLGPVRSEVTATHPFRRELARAIASDLSVPVVPMWRLSGTASTTDGGSARVMLLGVDDALARLGDDETLVPQPGVVRLSRGTMTALSVESGDTVVVRVARTTSLPGDSALTREEGLVVPLRLKVGEPLATAWPGTLSLSADPLAPPNALVALDWLQGALEVGDTVDTLLVAGDDSTTVSRVRHALIRHWDWHDVDVRLRETSLGISLTTDEVLLPHAIGEAATDAVAGATPSVSWFIDRFTHRDQTASYGFVTAVPSGEGAAPLLDRLPRQLGRDEIVLNTWLAEELGAGVGDEVSIRYPIVGRGRAIRYDEHGFEVVAVLEPDAVTADPAWVPPIDGIAERNTCADWDPGLPVDLTRITERDEAWWAEFGGAPKAYISLQQGISLWSSAHGTLTAVRYPIGTAQSDIAKGLLLRIRPEDAGFRFRDVSESLRLSATPANDFGALFLGFQFVLLVSALLLAMMQFTFVLERRARELGTLGALGWRRSRIRRLVLMEGAWVAALGSLAGIPLAWALMVALVSGLGSAWAVAVGGADIPVVMTGTAVMTGLSLAFLGSVAALSWSAHQLSKQTPRALLMGGTAAPEADSRRGWSGWLAVLMGCVGIGLAIMTPPSRSPETAAAFFGSGAAILGSGVLATSWWLSRALDRPGTMSLWRFALGGATRRPRRSLSVVTLISLGAFVVVGVGMGAGQAAPDVSVRSSGSGGFTHFAEAVIPVAAPPDAPDNPAMVASGRLLDSSFEVVSMRRVAGDDASCLQLGSAQTPHLVGVPPTVFAERGSFTFTGGIEDWGDLSHVTARGHVPAVGDVGTVTWGLHLGVGDVLTYLDERGEPLTVEIVGVTANSVFQGSLLVDEDLLLEHYPSSDGFELFLLDVPEEAQAYVSALERDLTDHGVDVVSTLDRLERFSAVEHTYVAIFHALGGLGLILGALGTSLVLARTMEERAHELALLSAVGFSARRVLAVVVGEQAVLLVMGLAIGSVAAAVAVIPVLLSPDAHPPLLMSLTILAATFGVGIVSMMWVARGILRASPARVLVRER